MTSVILTLVCNYLDEQRMMELSVSGQGENDGTENDDDRSASLLH